MLTRRVLSMAVGCALFASSGALADDVNVIWDAPPSLNPDMPAFVDQEFDDFPDFSTYLVAHIVLDNKYFIHEITTYYTNINNLWPQGAVNARLNIFDQNGAIPGAGDNPQAGTLVGANLAASATGFNLTTNLGGDLTLQAGEYWIGLTPILGFGAAGQEFHVGTDQWPKNTAARNPGGGFGLGTEWFEAGPAFGGIDWGMSITITGKKVPAPGALALLGMAGLVGRRRRRR